MSLGFSYFLMYIKVVSILKGGGSMEKLFKKVVLLFAGFLILSILLGPTIFTQASGAQRRILTGVPPFEQEKFTGSQHNDELWGCGPTAQLILLSYYDRAYGYKQLVRGRVGKALLEIYDITGTTTVKTPKGKEYGFTDPARFKIGLRRYIRKRYGGATLGSRAGTLDQVFSKSVELINDKTIHFILFDWSGKTAIFPNHYSVVVGYNKEGDRKELIINTGWGYDFQILDMNDFEVSPASIVWIKEIEGNPDGSTGISLGPPSAYGMFVTDNQGNAQLKPTMRKHFDINTQLSWKASDTCNFFFKKTGVCNWN